jgi:hypothetical protein
MLQYVGEAFPWAREDEAETLDRLRRIIGEEEAAVEDLARFLRRKRIGLPYLGSYPQAFLDINYVSLDFLLPRLRDHQRTAVAALERDLGQITDPEARAEVEKLLAQSRQHLKELEEMAGAPARAGTH